MEHRILTRFNYLGESLPTLFERVRGAVIPERLRTPLTVLVTAILVTCGCSGIENMLQRQADSELHLAQVRLEATRTALATLNIEIQDADAIQALDRQLRTIRRSGAVVGSRLADVANHLPTRAWLIALDSTGSDLDLTGATGDLDALSRTVSDLNASGSVQNTRLVRAARTETQNASSLVSFELRSGAATP